MDVDEAEDEPAPASSPKANGKKRVASASPVKELVPNKKRRIGAIINPIAKPVAEGLDVFVWGTGDNGQFGEGPDELDEKPRPQLQKWYVTCMFVRR
jgi:regulator of chromosome condensation